MKIVKKRSVKDRLRMAASWLKVNPRMSGFAIDARLKAMGQPMLGHPHTSKLRKNMGIKIPPRKGSPGYTRAKSNGSDPLASVIHKLVNLHGISEIHYADGVLQIKQVVTRTVKVTT